MRYVASIFAEFSFYMCGGRGRKAYPGGDRRRQTRHRLCGISNHGLVKLSADLKAGPTF